VGWLAGQKGKNGGYSGSECKSREEAEEKSRRFNEGKSLFYGQDDVKNNPYVPVKDGKSA
jgi:hypothetical protein